MVLQRLTAALAVSALSTFTLFVSAPSAKADATAEQLVDALNSVFGAHEGKRAAHTTGQCVKGSFTAAPEAASITKAANFNSKTPINLVGRYSMGGGNPEAPSTAKDNVRALALHFNIDDNTTTDLLMISAPVFVAKSPDQFLALLTAVSSKDKDKIGKYFAENPNSTVQGKFLAGRPVPASYTTVNLWGVHTFTATNAEGKKQIFKYKALPVGGEVSLRDDELADKPTDFYVPELKEHLAKGPAEYDLIAILGQDGDSTDDPTALWPEESRKTVPLGRISITGLEDNAVCDAGMFLPTNTIDGVDGPEHDTIFPMRSEAYAVSFSRRQK